MNSRKKNKMKTSDIVLIVVGVILIGMIITEHIFYWFKGSYPVELALAIIPTCLAELLINAGLTVDKRKYESDVVDSVDEATA